VRVGIAFDVAPAARPADGPDDLFEEYDKPETVAALAAVLRGEGHEVLLLGDGREFLAKILADAPDLVWNLAEGEGVGRCREARVPAALEMLGIPYTGSDPLTLAASLDKAVAKTLVAGVVAVPLGVAVAADRPADGVLVLVEGGSMGPGPWILKPAFEGSSKGIRTKALVDTPAEAAALFADLARDYRQPVLVEEFVVGDEVTVGVVGNGPEAEVMGVMRVRPRDGDGRFVYSLEVKRDWDERVTYETPAALDPEVTEAVCRDALAAYSALGCRDLARIDFRVRRGVPYFIEANPLPGLAPDWSDLMILARGLGMTHADVVRRVLRAALSRLDLPRPSGTGR